ncbi:MAG: ABC-F family ATP-binding cassette domain-containing protein [Clostridia bacterium]|nr:ABC-F family ATP-binding cassette domain-containing protein [Clostridia bacterium]
MAILNAVDLSMSFGENEIFSGVSFEIAQHDKVGFIGVNGAGKSTLFKILTKEYEPTNGNVYISKNCTPGYMSQHVCRDGSRTVYEEMLTAYSDVIEAEKELEEISSQIENNDGDINRLIERQQYLQTEFERRDGLSYKSRARSAVLGLGFSESDLTLPCSSLSGGQKSKLALGKLLLSKADFLLLDEPTNHLDILSVEWLEGFLLEYRGTCIIISHDRFFLDKVTNKTMEMEHGRLTVSNGNYTRFMQLKQERLDFQRKTYENTMREVPRIEGIIAQQKTFSMERNYVTIASKQKSIDRLLDGLEKPDAELENIRLRFTAAEESGNDVIIAKNLSKAYGEKKLFSSLELTVKKGERVFLLGDNGCGKSTLFNILMHRLNQDSGTFFFGSNVRIGYFDQTMSGLDESKTALDEVWDRYRSMTELEIRTALAMFLFKGDDVYKKVSSLSGGERARITLVKLMLSGANLLLLDEPTNHLDIGSREALEQALRDYEGTLFVISHDRYFINKLATRILFMDENGISVFPGNYNYFNEHYVRKEKSKPETKKENTGNTYKQRKERESELRWARGRLSRCEKEIEDTEKILEAIQNELALPEVSSDYSKVLELTQKAAGLNGRQEELMTQWEELSSRLEELEAENI